MCVCQYFYEYVSLFHQSTKEFTHFLFYFSNLWIVMCVFNVNHQQFQHTHLNNNLLFQSIWSLCVCVTSFSSYNLFFFWKIEFTKVHYFTLPIFKSNMCDTHPNTALIKVYISSSHVPHTQVAFSFLQNLYIHCDFFFVIIFPKGSNQK